MTATNINLTEDKSIEIGANYEATYELCNAPLLNVESYTGLCQIKSNVTEELPILTPTITVINDTSFKLSIDFSEYPSTLTPGEYVYDVLFSNGANKFYAVQGTVNIIKMVTNE